MAPNAPNFPNVSRPRLSELNKFLLTKNRIDGPQDLSLPRKERDMRAFAVWRFGEAPALHDLQVPAADGGFLIRVMYAGANPIDYKLLEKLNATSTYPFVMGIDFAGIVEHVRRHGDHAK
jgi:hypothetical protein